ncbi:TadE-like protein [Kerstersia gyiorum]|uniref:TadE-like protein n=2 Tax=Kerstersia gyiorum TaxID=206506 RepID=A0A4Q7MRB1_9BURK|nr:TadE-like protein [Kerstersia gyiorum]
MRTHCSGMHTLRDTMARGSLNGRSRQHGVAAIEFALVITVFLVILFAVISYGSLFWVQQRLSQAAGEGARAALELALEQWPYADESAGALAPRYVNDVQTVVTRAAHGWTLASNQLSLARAGSPQCPGAGADCLIVSVSYASKDWPLIGLLSSLAGVFGGQQGCGDAGTASQTTSCWIPQTLHASATVRLRRH